MRVVRVLVGMLTLLLAVPVLGAGALAWWVMQHRSPDGTFQAQLSQIDAPARIVVVPDVDALLHRDAPIARADQTELRLTVHGGGFIGMAAPADLAAYLAGVNYTELLQTKLGQGPLTVQTRQVTSTGDPLASAGAQTFWIRGAAGEMRWNPGADRDRHVAMIVIAAPGEGPIQLNVALTAGWLNSTTWGLLILGPVLLLLGLAALAWPQRPREIVYVVDSGTAAQAGLPAIPAGLRADAPIWRPAAPAFVAQPTPAASVVSPGFARGAAESGFARGVAESGFAATGATESGLIPPPAPPVEAGRTWPPAEPDDVTEPPREAPLPPDLPMPTAGMHLHLTKRS
jgi:hypothetical protein